jgi:hydrogenase maturation protease
MRGDDGAGPLVAELVRERAPELEVLVCEREPSGLIEAWAEAEAVIVVDAVAGADPGRVHRLVPDRDRVIERLPSHASSHTLGLGETLELARALGRLPARTVVYGIEGSRFAHGAGISDAVAARLDAVADAVVAEGRV